MAAVLDIISKDVQIRTTEVTMYVVSVTKKTNNIKRPWQHPDLRPLTLCCKEVQTLWENNPAIFQKLSIVLPRDPAIPFLGMR